MIPFEASARSGPQYQPTTADRTVADIVNVYGPGARARLRDRFDRAGIAYPPARATLLALKDTARLELWASAEPAPVHVETYAIRALSGTAGPKLVEGDRQVPEGIYEVEALNPNSDYHLSMKLNYPNDFDLRHALREGRSQPGSNIFIHGKSVSTGCLAMGDEVIEELFVIAADIGPINLSVAIAPSDPRITPLRAPTHREWIKELYGRITSEFLKYTVRRSTYENSQASEPISVSAPTRAPDTPGGPLRRQSAMSTNASL